MRLNQCLGLFTMLPLERSSATELFRHLCNHVFQSQQFPKFISYESHLFGKCSKFDLNLKNAHKNRGKLFGFCHISIWIVCIELSLLRRVYLSSAVNVLRKGLETLHITTGKFFQLNYLTVTNEFAKGSAFRMNQSFCPFTMLPVHGSS